MQRAALAQDVRNALRSLRRRPSVAVVAVLCLAIAISGNVTVFALINGLALRPLPFDEPERLVFVGELTRGAPPPSVSSISAPNLADWRQRQEVFVDLLPFRQQALGLPDGDRIVPVRGAAVAPGFFTLLGVEPILGGTFRPQDGGPGRERVALVTPGFYRRHFGEDPKAVDAASFEGVPLRFADGVYTIVGVLPSDFEWFGLTPDVWVALAPLDLEAPRTRRDLFALARLRDGISEATARAAIQTIAAGLEQEYPEANRGWGIHWANLRRDIPSPRHRQLVGLVQAALIVVMLIACVDVASLYLVRGRARARELAVRSVLGASSGRLALQMAIESLVVSLIAAGVGLGLAAVALKILRQRLAGQLPEFHLPYIDWHVLAVCVALALVASLVFGIAPMLQARRLRPADALRSGGRGVVGSERWAIPALVVAQIALSMALLGGAGLLVRSFLDFQGQDPGFPTAELVIFEVSLPVATYPETADQVRAADELVRRLDGAAGLDGAAVASLWPRATRVPSATVSPPDRPAGGTTTPRAGIVATTGDYFRLLDLEVEEGDLSAFTSAGPDGERVAVINRMLARRFFDDGDAVDRRLDVAGTPRRVVAVVADARHALVGNEGYLDTVYVPWAHEPSAVLRGTLRLAAPPDPRLAVAAVREAVAGIDPRLVVAELQPLDAMTEDAFFATRLFAMVLTGFGVLALLLAGIGTYGVLAYAISLRAGEIGVRAALGATRARILGSVLGHGLRLGMVGLALGLPLVWVAHRLVVGTMGTSVAIRPVMVVIAAVVLLLATVLAALLPAVRASRIDPARALRRT